MHEEFMAPAPELAGCNALALRKTQPQESWSLDKSEGDKPWLIVCAGA